MLGSEQQRGLLGLWLADPGTFSRTVGIVKPEYFAPEWRDTVRFVLDYYRKYNGIPSAGVINRETEVDLERYIPAGLKGDEVRYTVDELETFCKQSALRNIIVERSPGLIVGEEYDALEKLIREAISIRVDNNIGVTLFQGVEERSNDETTVSKRYSTGYPALDAKMDGGIAREEMMLVLAISGGGKSVSVLNIALNMMKEQEGGRFLNALYISLELPEGMIDTRSQMILTGRNSTEIKKYRVEIAAEVAAAGRSSGEMVIKKLRLGATANDIRALIKDIEIEKGWIPDIIVLDYLDKLHPMASVSTENIGMRDKFITEEFYDLLHEFNAIGLTASQLTKGAATVEVYDQSHQAGGAEKTRSSDWVLAIHLTDTMRASGQIGFQFLKTRSSDGVGSTVLLEWVAKSLQIRNPSVGGKRSPGSPPPPPPPPVVDMNSLFSLT